MDYELWRRIRRIQEDMERAFGDFFERASVPLIESGEKSLTKADDARPLLLARASADLYETDKEIVAKFDLPGMKKENIDLEVEPERITVRVEQKAEREEKRKNSYVMERSYTGYCRTLPLPPYAKIDNAKAEYKDGVLTVRIPKDEEKLKEKTRKIKVE